MQRLPPHNIQRADERSEIGLEEDPAPAGLRPGDEAALRARANFLGVHVKKRGGFVEIEGSHEGSISAAAAHFSLGVPYCCIQSPGSFPPAEQIIRQIAGKVCQGMCRVSADTSTA